jgi:hypothetical protein
MIYTTLAEVSETFLGFIGVPPTKYLEFYLDGVLIRIDALCYRNLFKDKYYQAKGTVKQTLDHLRKSIIVKGKHPDKIIMKDRSKRIPGQTKIDNLTSSEYRKAFRSEKFGKKRKIFKNNQ